MSRFISICTLASFIAMSFLLSSCRPGPETLKETAVQSITARNLEEYIVGSTLQGQNYIPGLEQMYRSDFNKLCKKYRISLDKPFYEILRSGFFDSVNVNAEMKTLKQSSNPLTRDDNLFRVTFNCEKKFPDGVMNFCFIFIVADTPMGRGILNWQMTITVNGKEEKSTNHEWLLLILGCVEHHPNGLIDYYTKYKTNNSEHNSKGRTGKN